MSDLNRRIATEFMGWKQMGEPGLGEYYVHNGVSVWEDPFSPMTDMRAAYIVLEKIASKMDVKILTIKHTGRMFWSVEDDTVDWIFSKQETLPLAISKLAEAIMDSPTHMELFK